MRALVVMSLFLGGCSRSGDDPAPPGTPGPDDSAQPHDTAPEPTLEALLEASGFQIGVGDFVFSTLDGCCAPGANCWGNNPSTPYGIPALPPSPGQTIPDRDLLVNLGTLPDPSKTRTFRMRADEAVVVLGRLPPRARYLSYRSYVGERFDQADPVIGSLGPSLNHLVIGDTMGTPDIWGEPFAFVTSMDGEIEERVHRALIASGFEPHQIHDDRIPPAVVRPGIGPFADTFFALMRVAIYDVPDAGAAFQAAPDYTVLRLTPAQPAPLTAPHPWPELPARGTGQTEDAWRDGLDALGTALVDAWPDHQAVTATAAPYWIETVSCVGSGTNCTGDIRDRFTAVVPTLMLRDDETFAVIYGVNHERTGKATYSSASVQTVIRQTGLQSLTSPEMPGTAAAYLPDHPLVDDLYAVVVARDCANRPSPCIEVPATCPGPALHEPIKITIRAYLEPATGAAPLASEMLGDRVVLFTPRED